MSAKNGEFCHKDGVQLKDFIEAELETIKTKIAANHTLYMEKFASSEQSVKDAFNASQTAINKSETGAEKRADAVYVTLGGLGTALTKVVSREEFVLSGKNADDKYSILNKIVGDVQLAMTKLMTIDTYEVRHSELQRQVDELKNVQSGDTGKGIGVGQGWGFAIGALGIVSAIIAILSRFLK
jgi:hypothetical protein